MTPFNFHGESHLYTCAETGRRLISVTQMIEAAGYTDSRFFTDEGKRRGTYVHDATAKYDLGAIGTSEPDVPHYRGYFLGYVKALEVIRPKVVAVEMAWRHSLGFCGTVDRVWLVDGLLSIVQLKTGSASKADEIQTALEAMLAAENLEGRIPCQMFKRYVLYVKANGGFSLDALRSKNDFREATKLAREMGTVTAGAPGSVRRVKPTPSRAQGKRRVVVASKPQPRSSGSSKPRSIVKRRTVVFIGGLRGGKTKAMAAASSRAASARRK